MSAGIQWVEWRGCKTSLLLLVACRSFCAGLGSRLRGTSVSPADLILQAFHMHKFSPGNYEHAGLQDCSYHDNFLAEGKERNYFKMKALNRRNIAESSKKICQTLKNHGLRTFLMPVFFFSLHGFRRTELSVFQQAVSILPNAHYCNSSSSIFYASQAGERWCVHRGGTWQKTSVDLLCTQSKWFSFEFA